MTVSIHTVAWVYEYLACEFAQYAVVFLSTEYLLLPSLST